MVCFFFFCFFFGFFSFWRGFWFCVVLFVFVFWIGSPHRAFDCCTLWVSDFLLALSELASFSSTPPPCLKCAAVQPTLAPWVLDYLSLIPLDSKEVTCSSVTIAREPWSSNEPSRLLAVPGVRAQLAQLLQEQWSLPKSELLTLRKGGRMPDSSRLTGGLSHTHCFKEAPWKDS